MLSDDSPVVGVKLENGLAITYRQRRDATRTFRLFDKFESELLLGGMELTSAPERGEGGYVDEADDWLVQYARNRFAQIDCKEWRVRENGDVSEVIARRTLSLSGEWAEVADHPIANKGESKPPPGARQPSTIEEFR